MRPHLIRPLVLILLLFSSMTSFAQKKPVVCRSAALAAMKSMPKLEYQCGDMNEWEERQLKTPARVAALKVLMGELEKMTDASWWQADVHDLNACDFKGEAGALSADERQKFVDGDYWIWLFGDNQDRLALIPDPCYQTEYGGSNAFLLHRKNGQVFVSLGVDGYFSRADRPVNLGFGMLNKQLIIEISTFSGGLNPNVTNYYFTIDPQTNKPVPKTLFAGEHGRPTNEITSAYPLDKGPRAAEPLNIIRGRTLARSFSVYEMDLDSEKFKRIIKRWNGKIYR
jgi:hypothetical protein